MWEGASPHLWLDYIATAEHNASSATAHGHVLTPLQRRNHSTTQMGLPVLRCAFGRQLHSTAAVRQGASSELLLATRALQPPPRAILRVNTTRELSITLWPAFAAYRWQRAAHSGVQPCPHVGLSWPTPGSSAGRPSLAPPPSVSCGCSLEGRSTTRFSPHSVARRCCMA